MNKPSLIPPDICPRCGQEFHCSKSAKCWCFGLSTTPEVLEYVQERWSGCLCPTCLETVANALRKITGEPPFSKTGEGIA